MLNQYSKMVLVSGNIASPHSLQYKTSIIPPIENFPCIQSFLPMSSVNILLSSRTSMVFELLPHSGLLYTSALVSTPFVLVKCLSLADLKNNSEKKANAMNSNKYKILFLSILQKVWVNGNNHSSIILYCLYVVRDKTFWYGGASK